MRGQQMKQEVFLAGGLVSMNKYKSTHSLIP